MSIDLFIDAAHPIDVLRLLVPFRRVLTELLGVAVPPLFLEKLEEGQRLPVDIDRIATDDGPLLLVSIEGEPETVGLLGGSGHVTVSVGGPRTPLQFALAAAAAIVLAGKLGTGISDDRRFFGESAYTAPEAMLERLRVTGSFSDYRKAAEAIRWGPGAS
jgi:hypothetical protein